jgi:hypothetical protein
VRRCDFRGFWQTKNKKTNFRPDCVADTSLVREPLLLSVFGAYAEMRSSQPPGGRGAPSRPGGRSAGGGQAQHADRGGGWCTQLCVSASSRTSRRTLLGLGLALTLLAAVHYEGVLPRVLGSGSTGATLLSQAPVPPSASSQSGAPPQPSPTAPSPDPAPSTPRPLRLTRDDRLSNLASLINGIPMEDLPDRIADVRSFASFIRWVAPWLGLSFLFLSLFRSALRVYE